MDSRPKVYDMYDPDCLDYGPYTPESSHGGSDTGRDGKDGSVKSKGQSSSTKSIASNPNDLGDYEVVDEVGDSEDERPRLTEKSSEQPTCERQVIDVGLYATLPSAACSGPEASRFGPDKQGPSGPSGDVEAPHGRKGKRKRSCPICFETEDRPRWHVMRSHLPWYWMPTTACWQCGKQEAQRGKNAINHTLDHDGGFTDSQLHEWCQLVNGALYLLAAWLECDTLDDLLRHVKQHRLYQDARCDFAEDDMPLLAFYAEHYSDI